jgi:DNA invertase Pin-like site-specific DNA recombinase
MLSGEVVAAINEDPRPHRTIAATYGVAKSTVYRIKNGKTAPAESRSPAIADRSV